MSSTEEPIQSPAGKENTEAATPKKKESKSDLIKKKIKEKLDGGFEVKDKHSVDDLKKIVVDELGLPKGWSSTTKNFLGEELKSREISLANMGFKPEQVGGVEVTVEAPVITETQEVSKSTLPVITSTSNTPLENPHGTLPQEDSHPALEQEKEVVPLTPKQLEMQTKFFKKCGNIVADIYIGMGLVETDDEEEKKELEKPKPIKEFRKEIDGLCEELTELMQTYGMRLPKYLDLGMFGLGVVVTFGVPILKRVMSGEKKPNVDYDSKLDEVDVD